MRHITTVKNSAYLTRADVAKPTLVTIRNVVEERVGQEKELKNIVYFNELPKGLVLNWSNAQTIAEILNSEDMDEWSGGKIVLYDNPRIEYAGKRVGGIRVRTPKPPNVTTEPEFANDIPF